MGYIVTKYRTGFFILLFYGVLLSACGGSSPATQRSFEMGFTPWPYDSTSVAVNYVYNEIANRGDIIAHHLDRGIPWQEALDGVPYPSVVESELTGKLNGTASGKHVYLALNPLNGSRTGIADYWGASNQNLKNVWAARDFDSAEVITAYINFSRDLISRFKPEYFNFGIEVSELAINDLARYNKYIMFASQVSSALKKDFPKLKLIVSIGLKTPGSASAKVINQYLPQVIPYVDVVGVSVYPFVFFDHADKGDPDNLPADWLSQIKIIANGKPVAITETGWIAERLQIASFGVDVMASAADQNKYVTRLFNEAESMKVTFIIWFALVDYDALWSGSLNSDPLARIWRDTGLYDSTLTSRPALTTWQNRLDRAFSGH